VAEPESLLACQIQTTFVNPLARFLPALRIFGVLAVLAVFAQTLVTRYFPSIELEQGSAFAFTTAAGRILF
jgi:hypothetical protein